MRNEFFKGCKMVINKFIWKITKGLEAEPGSRIYSSCKFEGKNRICRNSYVSGVEMGYGSYIGQYTYIILAEIGRFTSIGPNVRVTSGAHPTSRFVSTHPAFYSIRKQAGFTFVKTQKFSEGLGKSRSTHIGNDVWIGDSVLIMEKVSIGDGAIVAAGSLVTKDIPPYAIVAGRPATVLRYRFSETQMDVLNKTKWWLRDLEWIKEHAEYFDDIDTFINMLTEEGE